MSEIRVIEGEIFRDDRGQISSLNEFRFKGVERFYFIYHPDVNVVRGWHGHQYEKKWFYCVKGAFTLALVKIDNWENPSPSLLPEIFQLSDQKSEIICVPEGYANCLKAQESGSILLVYSGKIFQEALKDSWRYDKKLWVNWDKY
ncbi:WxcM-like domain-containing protein [Odoribacter laneus]|uniref:WxcM-like domain-containing protein n=1 Tax=Odoribacter laneus TaxID=626933 RepID=UPI0039961644